MKPPSFSGRPVKIRAKGIKAEYGMTATARQEIVPGFSQKALGGARIVLVGAGGIGGQIAGALVREGVGKLVILDRDTVDVTNLSRQEFFKKDLYKNKAICLAKNLALLGVAKTILYGIPMHLQEAVVKGYDLRCSVAVIAVDNDEPRVFGSRLFRDKGIPTVITGVSTDADRGYVFIQGISPEDPCLLCVMPEIVTTNERNPCAPGIIDILKVAGGYVAFGVVALLTNRKAFWNYRQFSMSGCLPEVIKRYPKNESCLFCGGRND